MPLPPDVANFYVHCLGSGVSQLIYLNTPEERKVGDFLVGDGYAGQRDYGHQAIPGVAFMPPRFILLETREAEKRFAALWRDGPPASNDGEKGDAN